MSNPYQSSQNPDPSNPFREAPYGGKPPVQEGDSTGGIIPYKNPNALMAYYFSIFTLLCCITPIPLGLLPVFLGIKGLKDRAKNPIIKGSAHAWIGIVLGGFSVVGSILMIFATIAAVIDVIKNGR